MSTLYENEYQVQSVIARYQREAAAANQLESDKGRQADGFAGMANALLHTLQDLARVARAHSRHASTPDVKAGPPVTILHVPK